MSPSEITLQILEHVSQTQSQAKILTTRPQLAKLSPSGPRFSLTRRLQPQPKTPTSVLKLNQMHLFLIRHGETEHNIAGLLAGVTDSRLTNHGVLQAQRLGKHLAAVRKLTFNHIYASDLQRAWLTADELRKGRQAYLKAASALPEIVKLDLLREQDFGSLELTPWASRQAFDAHDARNDHDFRHKETAESMVTRANLFIDDYLAPLWALSSDPADLCVAVVSHGLFLSSLWRSLLSRFDTRNIRLAPEVGPVSVDRPLEYMAGWTNTGYLELEITSLPAVSTATTVLTEPSAISHLQDTPPLSTMMLKVVVINGHDHLQQLKRTRGGIGSAAHDTRQKQIGGFFKRPKSDEGDATT